MRLVVVGVGLLAAGFAAGPVEALGWLVGGLVVVAAAIGLLRATGRSDR